jgi:hypothetical protein
VETDRPGREIDQNYREVITHLIDNEGWRYKKPEGRGYPQLFPARQEYPPIRVPKTGHTHGHRFASWVGGCAAQGRSLAPQRK